MAPSCAFLVELMCDWSICVRGDHQRSAPAGLPLAFLKSAALLSCLFVFFAARCLAASPTEMLCSSA